MNTDVNERKNREQLSQSTDFEYRTIFEEATEGILVANPEGRFIDANESICQMLGYSHEELLHLTIPEIVYRNDETITPLKIPRFEQDQMRIVQLWLKRKDDSLIYVEVRSRKLSDGRLVGFHRDITEKKKAEDERNESKIYLNTILNSIKDPIFVKDQNHQWILINDAFCDFIGHTREDLIGKNDYDFFPKSEADIFWKYDDQVMKTGIDCENEEEFMDSSGIIHTISTKKSKYIADSGESFLVGIIRDISERKRMENDILQSLKEKEVLIYEVHHRVNNNLQIISSLISMQMRTAPDDSIREFFRETQSRIRSIALVYELLSQANNVEQIDYSSFIKKLYKSVFELYSVDTSRIFVILKDTRIILPIIEAVPISLIIRELLSNSVLYAFPDGRIGEIRTSVEFDTATSIYTLTYDDNGIGIPDTVDFSQSNTMGMPLLYGLTKQLSGKISIECKEGMHVRITFPLNIKRNNRVNMTPITGPN